jgi:hypothetical protein
MRGEEIELVEEKVLEPPVMFILEEALVAPLKELVPLAMSISVDETVPLKVLEPFCTSRVVAVRVLAKLVEPAPCMERVEALTVLLKLTVPVLSVASEFIYILAEEATTEPAKVILPTVPRAAESFVFR